MTYQVLARKWRPRTFAEVVGQEHITRTLQNAILQDRVGHAYLFVGPRGIGKTTTARIFAKALNCRNSSNAEPCCACESCREIAAGSSLDVIEIDGASHNRVEHIRDLRDNVQYTPSRSRYKIYVIDEVHMLTPAAWNALLKTLEEPPPHVKFLFATTEPHKVLPTIVSRCQRFDLKRIPVPLIVNRLRLIAEGEGIHVEDRALAAIARAADGGMRDAQSIFDQMIAFCGGLNEGECIREQDVIDVFGLASGAELRRLAVGLLSHALDEVMTVVQGLADQGRDLERLYADLIGFLRNVMLCAVCPEPQKLLEVSDSELADLQAIAAAVDAGVVQRLLQGLVSQEWSFRSALNKRVYLEAALARVMTEAHSVQLDDIIAQLVAMAETGDIPRLAAPAPKPPPTIPPPPPEPPVTTQPPPHPRTQASPIREPRESQPEGEKKPPVPELPAAAEPLTAKTATPAPAATYSKPAAAEPPPVPETPPVPALMPQPEAEASATPAAQVDTQSAPQDLTPNPPEPLTQEPPDDTAKRAPEDAEKTPADAEQRAKHHPTAFAEPVVAWEHLLAELQERNAWRHVAPLLQSLIPVSLIDGILQLGYPLDLPEQSVRTLQSPETQQALQEAFAAVCLTDQVGVTVKRWHATLSEEEHGATRRADAETLEQVAQKPFVQTVCDLFAGSVVEVRLQQ